MRSMVTLKLNKEFKRAYYRGRFRSSPVLTSYLIPNGRGINRIGITTPKKIGKAVVRTRARRVIRAAYTAVRERLVFPQGYDLVFVARNQTAQTKSTDLARVMEKQLDALIHDKPRKKKKG